VTIVRKGNKIQDKIWEKREIVAAKIKLDESQ
jgi:hypothetical protein